MGGLLFLKNTVATPKGIAQARAEHGIRVLDQYAFTPRDLEGAAGLLLSQHVDERHLSEHRAALEGFLARGRAIAINGPFVLPALGVLAPYEPVGDGSAEPWALELASPHPITEGVRAEDLTFRRGVVGFWGRGTSKPPRDAVVLTRYGRSGSPADWVWRAPGGGRLFVHPGNDVWGWATRSTSAARVFPQLLGWMRGETEVGA